MKSIVLVTQLQDGSTQVYATLTAWLRKIKANPQMIRALQRRKMPFQYYGILFERKNINH